MECLTEEIQCIKLRIIEQLNKKLIFCNDISDDLEKQRKMVRLRFHIRTSNDDNDMKPLIKIFSEIFNDFVKNKQYDESPNEAVFEDTNEESFEGEDLELLECPDKVYEYVMGGEPKAKETVWLKRKRHCT